MVDGVCGDVWLKALGDGDFLFLFGTVSVHVIGQLYRNRWTIDSCFQNLKGRGFDVESTHVQSFDRLSKLMALVSIIYAFCLSYSLCLHKNIQAIKTKKHDCKSTSFSRHGLNHIRQMCRDPGRACSDALLKIKELFNWIKTQLTHYQSLKMVG